MVETCPVLPVQNAEKVLMPMHVLLRTQHVEMCADGGREGGERLVQSPDQSSLK